MRTVSPMCEFESVHTSGNSDIKAFAAETACVWVVIYEFNGVHVCKLLLALIYLLH